MTHRLLVALCITVCVGMFTEPHRGDADEVQNQKNDKKSTALAKVLRAQDAYRGQVESKQLESILGLDEAIQMIEWDIDEWKEIEVQEGGFPQSLKGKEDMILSLEQVRDGWKARITCHEAILLECATRPTWDCQIPLQSLTNGSIGQLVSTGPRLRAAAPGNQIVPRGPGQSVQLAEPGSQFLPEGMTYPARVNWIPKMLPPKESAVSSTKTQTPNGQPTHPDKVTEAKIAHYNRANSDPLDVVFKPKSSSSSSRRIEEVEVRDDDGKGNGLVKLTFPLSAQQIAQANQKRRQSEMRSKNLADESEFVNRLAPRGTFSGSQVDRFNERANDERSMLSLSQEAPEKPTKWLSIHGMKKQSDSTRVFLGRGNSDAGYDLTQMLIIDGTESVSYAGMQDTVPKAEVINLDELESVAPKRPTADEYLASDKFSEFQKTREEKSAARLNQRNGLPAAKKTVAASERKSDNNASLKSDKKTDAASLGSDEKTAADRVLFAKKFIELKKYDAAKKNLKEVIEQYPQTRARMEAGQLLKSLPK